MRGIGVAALLIALGSPSPAAARDLFVSARVGPGAADPGCGAGRPCTLGTAMAAARPGDRVFLAPGNYARFGAPVPRSDGTARARIEIRGNPANPNAVVLPGFRIRAKSHVAWRYFRCGDLEIGASGEAGERLRFQGLRVIGSLYAWNLSHSSLDSCRLYPRQVRGGFESSRFRFGTQGSESVPALRDTVRACSVHVVANARDWTTITDWKIQFTSEKSFRGRGVESCLFLRNRFRIVFQRDATTSARAVYWNRAQDCRFQENVWLFEDSTTGGCTGGSADQRMRVRDWVRNTVFLRDVFELRGNCGALMLSSQGSTMERWKQGRNRWDGCTFRVNTAHMADYGPVGFTWGMNADTVQNCVFVTRSGPCLMVPQLHAQDPGGSRPMTSVVRHNTFSVAGSAPAAFLLEPATGTWGTWDPQAALVVSRNIFHVAKPVGRGGAAAYYEVWKGRRFVCDQNLYFTPGAGRNRAVRFRAGCEGPKRSGCAEARFSEVGGTRGAWHRATRADAGSRWGDPRFRNPGIARFDPRPAAGTAAAFGPDGYAGARPPPAQGTRR